MKTGVAVSSSASSMLSSKDRRDRWAIRIGSLEDILLEEDGPLLEEDEPLLESEDVVTILFLPNRVA